MSLRRSLRAKTLVAVLLPTALALVAVAVIALYAYEQAARDVVQQRDTELVRLSAARVSAGLSEYTKILESLAADKSPSLRASPSTSAAILAPRCPK